MGCNGNRVNNLLMEPRRLSVKQKLSMMFSRQNSDLLSSKKVVKKKKRQMFRCPKRIEQKLIKHTRSKSANGEDKGWVIHRPQKDDKHGFMA